MMKGAFEEQYDDEMDVTKHLDLTNIKYGLPRN